MLQNSLSVLLGDKTQRQRKVVCVKRVVVGADTISVESLLLVKKVGVEVGEKPLALRLE